MYFEPSANTNLQKRAEFVSSIWKILVIGNYD